MLVVHNGIQYNSKNLPAHVNPKDCVPAAKWFRENRTTGADLQSVAPEVDSAAAEQILADARAEAERIVAEATATAEQIATDAAATLNTGGVVSAGETVVVGEKAPEQVVPAKSTRNKS